MFDTIADWDQRYQQQAIWTAQIRQYFIKILTLPQERVLEVGCGTGAILFDLESISKSVHGVDLDLDALRYASDGNETWRLSCADGYRLPYADSSFDGVVCHYLLLWLNDPAAMLDELMRITRPGGFVAAFAEPDYGGRVDYPEALTALGAKQNESLAVQGADPNMGRKLPRLFTHPGLVKVQFGVLGGQWSPEVLSRHHQRSEENVLENDLSEIVEDDRLDDMMDELEGGIRFSYIPTFYAWGFTPS